MRIDERKALDTLCILSYNKKIMLVETSISSKGFGFDLEGPLVNLEELHQQSFDQVVTPFGLSFTLEDLARSFAGVGDRAISVFLSEEIKKLDSTSGITADQIRNRKTEVYREMLHSSDVQPRPGVLEYIEATRRLSNNRVITSATVYEDAMYILRTSRLIEMFDNILTERDVTNLKPHPEVYLKAATILSILPQKLLVHEDSPTGVQAALSAGCPVIAFPVLEGVKFDSASPIAIFPGWVGLDPKDLLERYVV